MTGGDQSIVSPTYASADQTVAFDALRLDHRFELA
jgi:hypothetical protein